MRLWKSAETQQTYLLPTDLTWETESELIEYAVTSDEAESFVEAELKNAWQQVEGAFSSLATALTQPREEREPYQSAEPSPQAIKNGKSLVEDLLGISAEAVEENPDIAKDSVNAVFASIKTFIGSVLSDDEVDLVVAQSQMHNLQQTLDTHNIATNDKLSQLPQKLNHAYRSAKSQSQAERAADVDALAEQLDGVASTIVQALREHSAELTTSSETK